MKEDSIIVTLDSTETKKLKEYSKKDFPSLEIEKVENLTAETGKKYSNFEKNGFYGDEKINYKNYKTILKLTLKNKTKESVETSIKKAKKEKGVHSANPNYYFTLSSNSQYDVSEFNEAAYSDNISWALERIEAPRAWEITTGSSSIRVGVVSSGIDATHEDISQNIVSGNIHRDFYGNTPTVLNTPTDPLFRGTHIAGIIGAVGNNNIGTSGVCWNVGLVSLKVTQAHSDMVGLDSLVNAIDYSASIGLPIIDTSIYGFSSDEEIEALTAAYNNYSGLAICTAGNDCIGNNLDEYPTYPACCNCDNIITATASTPNEKRDAGRNFGRQSVDLYSPGKDIYSCYPGNSYISLSDTLTASAFVTGTAALALSINPSLSTTTLKNLILDNVDVIDGNVYCATGGRLNTYKTVLAAKNLLHAHNFSYSYEAINDKTHYSYCSCGSSIIGKHTFELLSNGKNRCTKCNYTKNIGIVPSPFNY